MTNAAALYRNTGIPTACARVAESRPARTRSPHRERASADTTAMTIKVSGATTTDYTTHSKWGAAYKPSGSGTNTIVAHIKSVSAMSGAKVVDTGANALILLVDQGATLSGTVGTPTVVALNGHLAGNTATAGPGAPSTTTNAAGTIQVKTM